MTAQVVVAAYGRPALEALSSVVAQAKADDPMAPVTLVVPSGTAGIVARRHLARGSAGRPGVAGLVPTTLPRLAEQLAAAALHPRRPTTDPVLAAAWRSTLRTGAGAFADVADHPATIRALVSAHRELRQLDGAALDAVAQVSTLSCDLVRLHRTVASALAGDRYDVADLLRTATQLLAGGSADVAPLGHVVLHLPQRLSPGEQDFVEAVGESAPLTLVVGDSGDERADAPVLTVLDRLGLARPTVERDVPRTATRVLHASDSDDEVRCVVREVAVALDASPAHRVAVLHSSAQPYARLLHEHLAAAGIAVNGPSTRAVHERAVARGFLAVLGLPAQQALRAAFFDALGQAPVRTAGTGRVPVSRWERVSRSAGIVGGGDWEPKLGRLADERLKALAAEESSDDPSPGRLDALRREFDSTQELAAFVSDLTARLAASERLSTWGELAAWATDLFHRLYGEPGTLTRLPPEEQHAASTIELALASVATLGDYEEQADLTGLVEVLTVQLESALPRVGRFGEGVYVGPLSSAVGLDLDNVFVVGLAEDAYPGRLHEDALLGEAVRLASGGQLEAPRERLLAKLRHLRAALASAPVVTATFPRGDLRRSTERLPSRWLLPTLREMSGIADLPATRWGHGHAEDELLHGSRSFGDEVERTRTPVTETEWRVVVQHHGRSVEDPVRERALAVVAARASAAFTRFDGNLTAAAGLPDHASSERPVSPTALESYATCPHGYFVRRLLGVEPLEQPEERLEISPADIGSLIHESFDALVQGCDPGTRPGFGEPWTEDHRRRLQELGSTLAARYEDRGVTGHPRLWRAQRPRILLELDRMLVEDSAWRAERRARVVTSELQFGMAGSDPVVVAVAGGSVRLRGSADKVDETTDGTLVVTDIKSGKANTFRPIGTDPVVGGTKLQLPVYALAARQQLGGDRVEAQYWFVWRERGQRIALPLDEQLHTTYASTVGTLVRGIATGVFPNKPPEKPSWGYVACASCTPDGLGFEQARSRYERKGADPALRELFRLIDPGVLVAEQDAGTMQEAGA